MKRFTNSFFTLTFALALFVENESSLPASTENETAQIVDNQKAETAQETHTDVQNNTPPEGITPDTGQTLSDKEASDDEGTLEDIRDIRPAVDLPVGAWKWIAISCTLLVILFALIYIFRNRRKNNQNTPIIPPDPYHKALQSLEAALQLIQRLDQRPFATGVTDSVRGYLADVFSLPAPECTTEEVLEQLPNVTLLTEEVRQNFTQLLHQCDLAKFTKMQFEQTERLNLYHQAKEFIQSVDKLIQIQNTSTTEQQ